MHLKYQFEALLTRLMDIITTGNAPFEYREIAAEYLVAFFRHLSHLPHEIYFNYDCDPFASNLLEDLLQLFSKNCFATPVNPQLSSMSNVVTFHFTSMQMLSLDALLAILKGLQKAELCREDVLVVCPATALVNVFQNKNINEISEKPKEEVQPQSATSQATTPDLDQYKPPEQEIVIQSTDSPQDVDVGSIRSEVYQPLPEPLPPVLPASITPPNVESTQNSDGFVSISPNDLSDIPELAKHQTIKHKVYVSYKYPKPENVAQNTEQIMDQKTRKVMLSTATEQFNLKATKGIQYLKDNNLIQNDMDIVSFLRDNPKLCKKQIGEYLSNKKNLNILQTFVESFAFKDTRLDEALRLFLESFRLPGEAPLISMILEHFAHHWRVRLNLINENCILLYLNFIVGIKWLSIRKRRGGLLSCICYNYAQC